MTGRRRSVSVLVAAALATAIAPSAQAIFRGSDAPIASYRFMVSLRLADTPDDHRCGGTLVAPDIVLTAAHCVLRVPPRGLVAVVGVDVPDWPRAPRVATLGHRFPATFDIRGDNRDDIAVVRLATPQSTPTISFALREPRVGGRVVTAGWGCTNAPPVCRVRASNLKASAQTVLRDRSCGRDVFWVEPTYNARTNICTRGARPRSTVKPWRLGRPAARSGPGRQLPSGRRHGTRRGQHEEALRGLHLDSRRAQVDRRSDTVARALIGRSAY